MSALTMTWQWVFWWRASWFRFHWRRWWPREERAMFMSWRVGPVELRRYVI